MGIKLVQNSVILRQPLGAGISLMTATSFFFVVDVARNYYEFFLNIALIHFFGLGHYEINMLKALFKLLWDVGLCR